MKLTDNEKREVLKLIEAGRPLPPVISTCEAGRNLYCLKQDFSPQSGSKWQNERDMMKLTDNEKREVLKLIEAGRPLPDKYRLSREPIHEWNTNIRMRAAYS